MWRWRVVQMQRRIHCFGLLFAASRLLLDTSSGVSYPSAYAAVNTGLNARQRLKQRHARSATVLVLATARQNDCCQASCDATRSCV